METHPAHRGELLSVDDGAGAHVGRDDLVASLPVERDRGGGETLKPALQAEALSDGVVLYGASRDNHPDLCSNQGKLGGELGPGSGQLGRYLAGSANRCGVLFLRLLCNKNFKTLLHSRYSVEIRGSDLKYFLLHFLPGSILLRRILNKIVSSKIYSKISPLMIR